MKRFIKNFEDFTCGHCGFAVAGTGYTNHCPRCLWSKHVDVHPGDRSAGCRGWMRPIDLELKHGESVITHQCEKCQYQKKNKASDEDREALIELAKKL